MAESAYLRLGHALCAANAKFTMNGLRYMIGHEANYRRWLQRYVWERTGLDWRSAQREVRQEFLDRFAQVYELETGKPLPSMLTNAGSEFLQLFADSEARSMQIRISSMMI